MPKQRVLSPPCLPFHHQDMLLRQLLWAKRELNPHEQAHRILSPARLPVSPSARCKREGSRTLTRLLPPVYKSGAATNFATRSELHRPSVRPTVPALAGGVEQVIVFVALSALREGQLADV